jgi:hypothetical protein
MSPDFVYHNINDGVDEGSSSFMAFTFINQTGCSTWARMPYSDQDHTAWPSEAAWREAAKYREGGAGMLYWLDSAGRYGDRCGEFIIEDDGDIALLKSLLAAGYCVVTGVWAGEPGNYGIYDFFSSVDVVDAPGTTVYPGTNHAQTIVGYKEGAAWDPAHPED